MANEPRQIAVVRAHEGYAGILAAFRARADELNTNRVVLGEIAGLTPGHMAKILAGLKGLGPESWGPTLGAHGMAIAFIEDPQALEQIASRLTPRNNSQVRAHAMASKPVPKWLWNPRNARRAARKRWAKMTDAQRKRAARKAWRTRRRKRREAQKKTAGRASPI